MSRPPYRLLATLVATLVAVTACGAPPSSGGDGGGREAAPASPDGGAVESPESSLAAECPLDALAEADGVVEIDLWFGGLVEPPSTVMVELAEAFNASQAEVRVTADNQGAAYAEVLRKYNSASSTPEQLPDLIYLEDTALGELVDKGQILPAEACMLASDYDPTQLTAAARAAYEVDGVLYPAYMNVSSPILYFNKTHFQQAGLDPSDAPTTLAELEVTARALKDAGVSSRPLSFLANDWFLRNWLAGVGQEVVDNDDGRSAPPTEAIFDTPAALEVLEILDRMNDDGLLNPFPVTEGGIDQFLAVATEDSTMLLETSTASGTIAAALGGDIDAGDSGIDLDAAVLDGLAIVPGSAEYPGLDAPGQIFAGGGAFYLLNTGSDAEVAASWRFMEFMLDPDNAVRWYVEGGYIPVVKEVSAAPGVAAFESDSLEGVLLAPSVSQLAAADPDRPGALIGPYTEFSAILRAALEEVLFGSADPAAALAEAEAEATELLERYNG